MERRRIHFSVDDTFGCFKYLAKNCGRVDSIWASATFRYAKQLHEEYNINVYFYCMYTDGAFWLSDVPSQYVDEFQAAGDWMKFGFHALGPDTDYSHAKRIDIQNDFVLVRDALVNITGGGKCLTDVIRLHFFSGNGEVTEYLKERGVNGLLCADDERVSYGLDNREMDVVRQFGIYEDPKTEMKFIRTDLRVEAEPWEIPADLIKRDCFTVFTHERYLKEPVIQKRIASILDMCSGL